MEFHDQALGIGKVFFPRINCSQMKLPNFGSPSSEGSSKIGRHFSNKVVLKLKSAKNVMK